MAIGIRDVMSTNIQYVDPYRTVMQACQLMADVHVQFLIVGAQGSDPEGVISATDVVERIVALGKDPANVMLHEVMTEHIIFADLAEDTISSIALKMKTSRIRRLPVLEHGRVVGVLSTSDIVKIIVQHKKDLLDLALGF